MSWSSTAGRCGPPTARRPTGCVCWPTPVTGHRTETSRSFASPWTCQVGGASSLPPRANQRAGWRAGPFQTLTLSLSLTLSRALSICLSAAGVHVARNIGKLGMWSSDTAEIFFDNVRVPCSNIIGQEGMGFTYQMLQFQEERLWAVANSKWERGVTASLFLYHSFNTFVPSFITSSHNYSVVTPLPPDCTAYRLILKLIIFFFFTFDWVRVVRVKHHFFAPPPHQSFTLTSLP